MNDWKIAICDIVSIFKKYVIANSNLAKITVWKSNFLIDFNATKLELQNTKWVIKIELVLDLIQQYKQTHFSENFCCKADILLC